MIPSDLAKWSEVRSTVWGGTGAADLDGPEAGGGAVHGDPVPAEGSLVGVVAGGGGGGGGGDGEEAKGRRGPVRQVGGEEIRGAGPHIEVGESS